MLNNLTIVGLVLLFSIIYIIYALVAKKELLDHNHVAYWALGSFTFFSGLALIMLILALVSNSILKTHFDVSETLNVNDYLLPLALGGLMTAVAGINNLRTLFQKKIK